MSADVQIASRSMGLATGTRANDLPGDVWRMVCRWLTPPDIQSFRRTCKAFADAGKKHDLVIEVGGNLFVSSPDEGPAVEVHDAIVLLVKIAHGATDVCLSLPSTNDAQAMTELTALTNLKRIDIRGPVLLAQCSSPPQLQQLWVTLVSADNGCPPQQLDCQELRAPAMQLLSLSVPTASTVQNLSCLEKLPHLHSLTLRDESQQWLPPTDDLAARHYDTLSQLASMRQLVSLDVLKMPLPIHCFESLMAMTALQQLSFSCCHMYGFDFKRLGSLSRLESLCSLTIDLHALAMHPNPDQNIDTGPLCTSLRGLKHLTSIRLHLPRRVSNRLPPTNAILRVVHALGEAPSLQRLACTFHLSTPLAGLADHLAEGDAPWRWRDMPCFVMGALANAAAGVFPDLNDLSLTYEPLPHVAAQLSVQRAQLIDDAVMVDAMLQRYGPRLRRLDLHPEVVSIVPSSSGDFAMHASTNMLQLRCAPGWGLDALRSMNRLGRLHLQFHHNAQYMFGKEPMCLEPLAALEHLKLLCLTFDGSSNADDAVSFPSLDARTCARLTALVLRGPLGSDMSYMSDMSDRSEWGCCPLGNTDLSMLSLATQLQSLVLLWEGSVYSLDADNLLDMLTSMPDLTRLLLTDNLERLCSSCSQADNPVHQRSRYLGVSKRCYERYPRRKPGTDWTHHRKNLAHVAEEIIQELMTSEWQS